MGSTSQGLGSGWGADAYPGRQTVQNQGRMEPWGAAAVRAIGAGLMGRQRFLSDTERKRLYFKARAAPFCLGQP